MNNLEIIDEETGEILESAESALKATGDITALPSIAVAVKRLTDAYDKRVAVKVAALEALDRQRAYIEAVHERRCKPITDRIAFLQTTAQGIMDIAGEKKLAVPGTGTFRYRKQRAMVDDTEWGGLSSEEQECLAIEHPELIKTVTKYQPDKKAIMEQLQDEGTMRGFCIPQRPDVFEFEVDRKSGL